MNRRIPYFELGFFIAVVAAHVVISLGTHAALLRWYQSDDAFYYFRTARNIAMGLGSTFDGVSLTNGYHPLWMLICVPVFAFARIDPWLPLRMLIVVSGTLTAAGGVLLFRMISPAFIPEVGALAAILWGMWPPVHAATTQLGLENALNGFSFILVLYLLSGLPTDRAVPRRQLWGISISLALLVLARLDNVFVAGLFGLWAVLATNPFRTRVVLYALITALSLGAGMLWRLGPGGYLSFKTGASIMLVAGWVLQVPTYLLTIRYGSPRFQVRAVSIIGAGLGATALLEGVALILRFARLASFPLLAPLYMGVIAALLVFVLEAYLWWLNPRAPGVSAWEGLASGSKALFHRALVVFGVLGLALAGYMVWSLAAFDTPIPVSGQIKEWWGTIYSLYGRPPDTVVGFLGLDPTLAASPIAPIARALTLYAHPFPALVFRFLSIGLIAVIMGLFRAPWLRERTVGFALIPLGCGMAVLDWFYSLRGSVNLREWYWIGVYVFGVIWVGLLVGLIWRWASRGIMASILPKAVIAVCLAIALNFAAYVGRQYVNADPSQLTDLERALRFLSNESEPGSLIGVTGGGTMGYFLEGRSIVNLDGLANSVEYFRSLRRGEGASFLKSIGLDYVFAPQGMLPATEPYLEMFERSLTPLAHQGEMTLFRFGPPAP